MRVPDFSWYITAGIVIFLMLYLLQPFGFSQFRGNKFLVALGFGVITSICNGVFSYLFFGVILRKITKVTVLIFGLFSIALMLLIALANSFYAAYVFHVSLSWQLVFIFLYWGLIVGVVMTVISMSIQYNRFLRTKLNLLLEKTDESQRGIAILIHDQAVRGSHISILINDFLYAEARKNNVSVCYQEAGLVVKREIRATLSGLLAELPYPNIFQCHRSFVVNVNNITSAKGNSNGYQLHLGNCEDVIPVSRTFVRGLKSFIG